VDVSIVAWVAGSTLSTWRIHQGSTWRIHQGFLCSQHHFAARCSDNHATYNQKLGSRDPFRQYLEVGRRGCEYCSLGSRFNTPPAWVGGNPGPRRWDKPPATLQHVFQTTTQRTILQRPARMLRHTFLNTYRASILLYNKN
jgi:hypothetical protein